MKVAFVSQPLNHVRPHVQGDAISIWIDQVARRLAPACDVSVFSPRYREDPPVETCEDVEYCAIHTRIDRRLSRLLKPVYSLRSKLPQFASVTSYAAYALRIAAEIRKRGCDVVHIVNFMQFARIVRALNPQVKILLHMHCDWLNELDYRSVAKSLNAVDGVVGCSDFIAQRVRKRFPWFRGLVAPLLNGVDTDVFSPLSPPHPAPSAGQTILFVARVSPEKGVHVLLDAFSRICARFPDARLDLVGPISTAPREYIVDLSADESVKALARFYNGRTYREHLEQQLSTDVASRVSFVGSIPHARLVESYRRAAVFAFPSVWDEPFGMPNVEAMACGVPVVATQGGGIPELIVDGQTGLLVERNNAAALADALDVLLADHQKRQVMGEAGRRRAVELFGWDRIAESAMSQYQSLLAGRSAQAADQSGPRGES